MANSIRSGETTPSKENGFSSFSSLSEFINEFGRFRKEGLDNILYVCYHIGRLFFTKRCAPCSSMDLNI